MKHLQQHWSMTSCLIAVALLTTFLPNRVLAGEPILSGETVAPDGETPFYYPLRAGVLDHPTGEVTARIEYRSGDRVLEVQELTLDFEGREAKLLPVQPFPGVSPLAIDVPELEIYVFADGLLVEVLDRDALRTFERDLQGDRLPELRQSPGLRSPGFDGEGTLQPVEPDALLCGSPCGGGCGPSDDFDCDGVANSVDNCTDDYNPSQADCDGDGYGDACDGQSAVYQAAGPVQTCLTYSFKKDSSTEYWDHYVEQEMEDVSACNAPNFWNRWIRHRDDCSTLFDPGTCCLHTIGDSITAVGDDKFLWCGTNRKINFCH